MKRLRDRDDPCFREAWTVEILARYVPDLRERTDEFEGFERAFCKFARVDLSAQPRPVEKFHQLEKDIAPRIPRHITQPRETRLAQDGRAVCRWL